MSALLDTDERVAANRLYRALDRMVEHKEALEEHLALRWKDLFGATFDVLLYDLTSTYFEGEAKNRQSPARLLARSPAGLQADHYRAGCHPGRFSALLRSLCGQPG